MSTELELSLLAAIAADPSHRWSGLSFHASLEAVHLSEVVDEVDDKDDNSAYNLLDQSEPESRQVVANSAAVEDAKEFEEQLEEGLDQVPPEDLAEYLVLVHNEDIVPMNFVGLDIADKKTSAGKEGDAVSTQRVYKRINAKYSLFLADLLMILSLIYVRIFTFLGRPTLSIACSFASLSIGTFCTPHPLSVISVNLLCFFNANFPTL
jgi:hypothetical protein